MVSAEPVGLLQEAGSDLKNDQLLMGIYDKKFLPEYGLKFVNLVDRPTIDVTELKKGEEQAGVRRTYRPKVVCFIGKVAFKTFCSNRTCDWGRQTEIGGARVYLMYYPIRGAAAIRVKELTEVKRASGEF